MKSISLSCCFGSCQCFTEHNDYYLIIHLFTTLIVNEAPHSGKKVKTYKDRLVKSLCYDPFNPHPVLWGPHGPRKDLNRHPTLKKSDLQKSSHVKNVKLKTVVGVRADPKEPD